MRDEPQEILAVDRRVAKTSAVKVTVRVQAATAYLHYPAGLALWRQGVGADLPSYSGGVVQRFIEAVGGYVQAHVSGARIGGAKRVELLD